MSKSLPELEFELRTAIGTAQAEHDRLVDLCLNDKPHNHQTLRMLQAIILRLDDIHFSIIELINANH